MLDLIHKEFNNGKYKIETTGIEELGICTIQDKNCISKQNNIITIVNINQKNNSILIKICNNCLIELMKNNKTQLKNRMEK